MDSNTESEYQQRIISYEELKQHSSYSDGWLSINGVVYDITHFIDKHPFGDTFRGHLGTECGGLFSSAHTNTNVEELIKNESFLKKNEIKIVGRLDVSKDYLHRNNKKSFLDRIIYKNTDKDEFWQDLRSNVAAYLKETGQTTHYTTLQGILFILYFLSIYVFLSYFTWVKGSFIACFFLSIDTVCMLSNIAHMATHSGFTVSPAVDYVAMHLFDLAGMSGLEWQITHQTHHNQPHSSIDHQANTYNFVGVRIHDYMELRSHHKFQSIYFWITVPIYLPLKMIITTLWIFYHSSVIIRHNYDILAHIFAKSILLGLVYYCAQINGFWLAFALFAMYLTLTSETAFLLLFNDHEENHKFLSEVENISSYQGKKSWAEVQVRTSGNWYPTNWVLDFIEFHYGYFNYHIEHHLFPTFKPTLFKKISPIVKKICKKHGIPYISTPFIDMQKSLQGHLVKMGLSTKGQVSKENHDPATSNGCMRNSNTM